MSNSRKRHIVTGGAGLIGFEVTKQLLERGDSVLVLDNFLKGGEADLAEFSETFRSTLEVQSVDLTEINALQHLNESFDSIFHFAAIVGVHYVNTHPYETARVNTLSTMAILDVALRTKSDQVLFASSSENYASGVEAGHLPLPTPEEVPLSISEIQLPRWSYAASKILGESALFGAAEKGQFTAKALRFHNVYGPRMGPTHVIPEFIERSQRKIDPFPIYGYDATRSFLYVEDAARAVLLVADAPSGIYNIGSDVEVPIAVLAERIFDLMNFHPQVDKRPAPLGSVTRRVPDIQKLKRLGFTDRYTLEDALLQCIQGKKIAH